jgi:hypothetical protein
MQHAFMKRPSIRITFVIMTLAVAAAIVIGALVRRAAGRELREAILAELQPGPPEELYVEALWQRQRRRIPNVRESD